MPKDLSDKLGFTSILGIKKINVINNVIIIYCEEKAIIDGVRRSIAFFVITTQDAVTKEFTNEKEFTQCPVLK